MVQTSKKRIQDIKGDKPWSALERELLVNCRAGVSHAGIFELPDPNDTSRHVRPELITYLLLGGCEDEDEGARPTAEGVWLAGAYLTGELEFVRQITNLDLVLFECRLPSGANLMDAKLGGLSLQNCWVESGLDLHRIKVQNDVLLRAKNKVQGGVDLGGARIGGQLSCREGSLENAEGPALTCNRATIGKSVFLSDAFSAKGEVSLVGARIGGQLGCRNGCFENTNEPALDCDAAVIGADVFLDDGFFAKGMVNFTRARIAGNLHLSSAQLDGSLGLETAQIGAGLFFQKVTGYLATFDLTEAKLGSLRDDAASWGRVKFPRLSGLDYDRIDSNMTLEERLSIWGRKHERALPAKADFVPDDLTDFDPQPHTQLAKALETQGRRGEAAWVRYEREWRLSRAKLARANAARGPKGQGAWRYFLNLLMRVRDKVFSALVGYGHRPVRTLGWTLLIITGAILLYGATYDAGQMAPNSDVILASAEWTDGVKAYDACVKAGGNTCILPQHAWAGVPEAGIKAKPSAQDYESFSRIIYAIDLFVPLDALGQESTWAPTYGRGGLGNLAYWMRMPIQVMGWVIAAVGAAVVTGVIGRKDR